MFGEEDDIGVKGQRSAFSMSSIIKGLQEQVDSAFHQSSDKVQASYTDPSMGTAVKEEKTVLEILEERET
jgi:hypothetical protein